MAENYSESSSYRSRYGIEKLRDHTYHTWSFQCRMLLSERKVWKVVSGEYPRPIYVETLEGEDGTEVALSAAQKNKLLKEINEWDEKDEEALRIISFTVSDQLQGPIHYGKTSKGAWDELQRVHASNDKQRKFSLLRRLYRLDMSPNGSLIDHERTFDDLVQNLSAIGKTFDPDELIVIYASSLPVNIFSNWIQSQMAFIDKLSLAEFKSRAREEARRLNIAGLDQTLGVERDPDTVQANLARSNRIFPPRKPNVFPPCTHCGYKNHTEQDCHKRIAEEYNAKQARKSQKHGGKGGRGRRGGRGGGGNDSQTANLADANPTNAPAYNAIFGGLAFCCKAAVNGRMKRVNGVWIKDNGATHHMHHDKSLFTDYHSLKHRLYIGGIGSGLKAVGIGDVSIKDPNGNERILKGVLHVPKLKCGLMSLNTLALLGWTTTIKKVGCTVSHGNFKIHSPIRNGLCIWGESRESSVEDVNSMFASVMSKKLSMTDWHERLAHVSKDTLLRYGKSAFEDFHIDLVDKSESEDQSNMPCKPCIFGKHHRSPFRSRSRRRGNPLESVHTDLCESNVTSLGGGKHVLTFTDDCTNHGMVYILQNKSAITVLKAFKEYQAWAERQSGFKIKELRTDRGTEYMGEMIEYVKSQGIEHNPTAGYSPQSNGVAERMNRTLFDKACTMLDASGAPLELWAEAILAAAYIRNRLPSQALNGKTPHEAWTGQKPSIGHIRKWGCKVYRHINKKTGRKKLHKKSMMGFLVGYQSGGIYRIYHPGTKEFKISRDVIFSEKQFFDSRKVNDKVDDILSTSIDEIENGSSHEDESDSVGESGDEEQQADNVSPIIHNEITVQPLSTAPNATAPPNTPAQPSPAAAPPPKPPNRRTRRMIAKAFKAVVKGNWKWPRNFREAMEAEDAQQWKIAMQKEYDSIMRNDTWILVPRPKDAKVVKSRWVLRIKDINNLYKARFCAKGFTQRWGEDYDETYAPVAKYTSIRTLFALLAGRKNTKVHQMDVNTAFLNSDLDEVVYVEQPEGFVVPGKEDFVCLLRKALYGLKQSPRAWFQLIATVLVDFDFQQSESDPCIFVHKNANGECTYIALYVDDLIIAGDNEEDIVTIKQRLSERFDMKDLGIARRFLGMEIEYGKDGSIKIHQNRYIQQLLERHGMGDCNPAITPMDTSVKLSSITSEEAPADAREYASIVGGLMFAACVTRPDIMCSVSQLSQFLNNPSSKHMQAAKRVLRYLQGTPTLGITYRPPPLRLQGYSDADWAGDIDTRRSTTGYVVMLNNGAIAWKSRRQPTVALSTMESEYMALTEATKELKWIRTLLAELGYSNNSKDEPPTDLFSDNQSAIALAKNPVSHARAKHIDLRHHFVREAIQDKVIWVQYIPTTEMTADSLTKALGREKHEKCTTRMGMTI